MRNLKLITFELEKNDGELEKYHSHQWISAH